MPASDAHQMLLDGVMDATDIIARRPAPVYAYHIYQRPGEAHWRARYHRMIFSDPISVDEAVQRVIAGLSCYVERDGLKTAIEQLAAIGIKVECR